MKAKILVSVFIFVLTLSAHAASFSYKAPELKGTIVSPGLELTDWQAVMSCHFDHKGVRKESIRYPQTWVEKTGTGEYTLKVKKGSLSEMLPGWKLLTCAYKLILIGKDQHSLKTAFGEIYLLGQEHGEMNEIDLRDMMNKEWVGKVLSDKTAPLRLLIAIDGGIVSE